MVKLLTCSINILHYKVWNVANVICMVVFSFYDFSVEEVNELDMFGCQAGDTMACIPFIQLIG